MVRKSPQQTDPYSKTFAYGGFKETVSFGRFYEKHYHHLESAASWVENRRREYPPKHRSYGVHGSPL